MDTKKLELEVTNDTGYEVVQKCEALKCDCEGCMQESCEDIRSLTRQEKDEMFDRMFELIEYIEATGEIPITTESCLTINGARVQKKGERDDI